MLKSETSTDPWEEDDKWALEVDPVVTIGRDHYQWLIDDSELLYALRKIGAVPLDVEEEARDFLREEGDMDA